MQVIKPNTIGLTDGAFVRASTATYVDFDGIIKSAANNIPRFNYNPSTLVFDGLLVEAASTNLTTYSEQFDNAIWVKNAVTVTANNTVSPDGATTADKILETTANSTHFVDTAAFSFTAGLTYTLSVFVKAAERNQIRLQFNAASFGAITSADFDVSLGTVIATANSPVSTSITKYSNGWYRCSISAVATTTASSDIYILLLLAGASSYTGVATSGLFLWGSQLEQKVIPSSYIPVVATAVTRAADTVTGTNLIYTTATDPNAVWSSGTTYTIGQRVRYLNIVYESLQNSNLNKTPTTNPTFWLNLGYDNLHAALDTITSTSTTATTEVTMVVKVDSPAALAFINVEASVIEISCTDQTTGEIFYRSTLGLTGGNVQDWYQYFFFDPLVKRTQIVITDLGASFLNVLVTIRLKTSVGEPVGLGTLIAGPLTTLGQLQTSPTVGIIDYSKKETDEFGNFTFVQRAFSKRLSAEIFLDNTLLNGVQRYLTNLRATPALWIGSTDPQYEEALIVYGFYKDFSTTIAYPQVSLCSLEIEGLT